MQGLRRARQAIAQEIEQLEQNLERMHGSIQSGRGAGASREAGGLSLNAFMDRVRQMRDQIQEKRGELSRIDRAIARERQLRGTSADEPKAAHPTTPTHPETSSSGSRAKTSPAPIPGRAALNALRSVKFTDRAEYLLVQGLAEGLTSDDAEVRRRAVVKLGARPQPVVSLLLLAADDPEDTVRLAALGTLTGQRHPALAGLFRRFLRDKNAGLRLAALRGLASIDDPQLTHNDLAAALEDGDAGVRRVAASVLSWHREEAKMPLKTMHALGLALSDEDEAVRVSAAEALGTAGDDRTVLALIRSVGDPSDAVSKAAQRSLSMLVGNEIDSVAQGAPGGERVEALKTWWRGARVRLRGGPAASGGETVESAGKEVLQTLATMKGATGQVATGRAAPAPAGSAEPAKKAKAAPAAEAKAPEAKPAPAPAQNVKAAPEAQAPAGSAGEAAPAPGAEEKGEFESMFQENEEAQEAGEEGYETLLGDKES
jgi:HEAT repeat protein